MMSWLPLLEASLQQKPLQSRTQFLLMIQRVAITQSFLQTNPSELTI